MIESAIYKGKVYHQRFKPTQHKFDYDIYLFCIIVVLFDLLPELHKNVIKMLNPIMKIIENITNWFVYLFSPKVIK